VNAVSAKLLHVGLFLRECGIAAAAVVEILHIRRMSRLRMFTDVMHSRSVENTILEKSCAI